MTEAGRAYIKSLTARAEGEGGHGRLRLRLLVEDAKKAVAQIEDEALAAAESQREALDVERLAEAWGRVMDGRRIISSGGIAAVRLNPETTTAKDWAAIAREYAALKEQPR